MNQLMSKMRPSRTFYLLAVIGLTIWAQHSWLPGFFQDGYLYAAFGKNAAENGNWLIPHLSSSVYAEFGQHTPFFFILEGIFFKVFGSSYVSARLFGTIFTFSTMSLIFYFAKYFEKNFAFLSAFIFILIPPLIKKTRFPNMDLPLMFWIMASLVCAFIAIEKNKKHSWIYCGIFFGLAMLTKGPIAFSIPLAILVYLLSTKKSNLLLAVKPWLGIAIGFLIFSLWPFCLYMSGRMDIFFDYYKTIFIDTAYLARGQPSPFYIYFKFLLITCLPWFLLVFFSIYLLIKQKIKFEYKNILIFLLCYFIPTFLILSMAKFKYSHYLIPLYPAMSMIAAISIISVINTEKIQKFKIRILLPIALILPLVFVIFPIGTKTKRDPEIFKTLDIYRGLQKPPNAIGVIEDAYPFYSLANLMGYHKGPMVFVATIDTIKYKILNKDVVKTIKRQEDDRYPGDLNTLRWSFMLKTDSLNRLKNEVPNLNNYFSTLIYFQSVDLYILIEKLDFNEPLLKLN